MDNYPSKETVKEFQNKWNKPKNYPEQESALNKLFFDLCPENKSLDDIMIKCAALNDFYSTNIFNIAAVAKHIQSWSIDERLRKGDVDLVEDIACVKIDDKQHRFYSFATKYCSHHQPKLYSIYDNYVHKLLVEYNKIDRFCQSKNSDLRDYREYRKIIDAFRIWYGLEDFTLKELDKYL